ncbi:Uncharacterised protein [Salmonella enterica subsp. enterica serovar Bovismorbificans]|uniref:Uncharacterized protein n=1 Tax=Salmonella enterica subsp. enterica serovar Bovismorbificans TaxID=58097 RepID=A0A655BTJ2_SALET|nr:Uncharacterised protein [Salmonella enterica subsp. enterica serovar Bovismorbificans]
MIFFAVTWLTIPAIRSETGPRVPNCHAPLWKRNGRMKSTPLILLSGIQALPPFNTPCPPASNPCPCAAEKATCAYSEPSRSVIFQSGGSNGWKTISDCFGHQACPRRRSPSQRPFSRTGPIAPARRSPLNWNRVGSRPSTLKLMVEGGSMLPLVNMVFPASRDSAPCSDGIVASRTQTIGLFSASLGDVTVIAP